MVRFHWPVRFHCPFSLIPPAIAASLFVALNVHPLWGLRIARKLHATSPVVSGPNPEDWRDEDVLPEANLKALARCLQDFLCDLVTFLSNTPPATGDDFANFVTDLCKTHHDHLATTTVDGGLDVVIEDATASGASASQKAAQRLAEELLTGVFIPAGVARRVNDSLQVDCDLLASSIVGIDQLADGER